MDHNTDSIGQVVTRHTSLTSSVGAGGLTVLRKKHAVSGLTEVEAVVALKAAGDGQVGAVGVSEVAESVVGIVLEAGLARGAGVSAGSDAVGVGADACVEVEVEDGADAAGAETVQGVIISAKGRNLDTDIFGRIVASFANKAYTWVTRVINVAKLNTDNLRARAARG